MPKENYLALKNGSDVRGIFMENREVLPVTLTEEAVADIAKAFCVWLISHTGKVNVTIAVGYDSRISSPAFSEAIVRAVTSIGHSAVSTDLSTTPSMLALLKDATWQEEYPCEGSIMITASHLPSYYNGMKFFFKGSGLASKDIEEILTLATSYRFTETQKKGSNIHAPYLDRYAANLVAFIQKSTGEALPLLNQKIIVDAGNGVGGFYATKVLLPLGADILGSQFLEPDGTFPNHIPNPENEGAILSLRNAVKENHADFGIIFDTDVDRAGAVDQDGNELNRNRLIALISAVLLEEKSGTIVTDSVTSDGLTKFIESRGGRHHRYMRGYKNVIDEATRLNKAGEYTPLAIETSGHAALLENGFQDDGAYLITRLLIAYAKAAKQGKKLTDLIADLESPKETLEFRIPILEKEDIKHLGRRVIDAYYDYTVHTPYVVPAKNVYEGARANYDEKHGNGWALIRQSLHEPLLPINVESASQHGGMKIAKDIYYFLKQFPFLDLTPLEKAIEKNRQRLIKQIQTDFYTDVNYLSFIFGKKVVLLSDEPEPDNEPPVLATLLPEKTDNNA